MLNETHDPTLRSWVKTAQDEGSDFPIQNLPWAVFRRAGSTEHWRGGVAIGDQIVDLSALDQAQLIPAGSALARAALQAGAGETLNDLMALGRPHGSALRLALSHLLRVGAA